MTVAGSLFAESGIALPGCAHMIKKGGIAWTGAYAKTNLRRLGIAAARLARHHAFAQCSRRPRPEHASQG